MGYAVYADLSAGRWAGYGVPAECDMPRCTNRIDRGLDYICSNEADHCGEPANYGMYFCYSHIDGPHTGNIVAKPDTMEWKHWQLVDDSWEEWRSQNIKLVEQYTKEFNELEEPLRLSIIVEHNKETALG